MALNATLADRRELAAVELATKLRLERIEILELREFFRNMASDLGTFYIATGTVLNANNYTEELTAIVTRQYNRTARAFSGQLIDFIRENPDGEADQLRADLTTIATGRGITLDQQLVEIEMSTRAEVQAFLSRSIAEDVRNITRTNQKMLDIAVAQSIASFEEVEPTRQQVAKLAVPNARNRGFNRAPTIAATSTQKAAEGTKAKEVEQLVAVRNGTEARIQGITPLQVKRIWMTMGDDLVRGSHLLADFQESEGGTFTVQGQLLKFPGDTDLGATADNVINCRCSAVTIIED